jgi:hypothetical protein
MLPGPGNSTLTSHNLAHLLSPATLAHCSPVNRASTLLSKPGVPLLDPSLSTWPTPCGTLYFWFDTLFQNLDMPPLRYGLYPSPWTWVGHWECLYQAVTNIFYKDSDKYFRFCRPQSFITMTQLYYCSVKAAMDNTYRNGYGFTLIRFYL